MRWRFRNFPKARNGSTRPKYCRPTLDHLLSSKEEMKTVWLNPELVAQIEFTEWTPDGHLRHSKFVGLREDKDPREVMREPGS
jgi:ATP-dependent DNA ligase